MINKEMPIWILNYTIKNVGKGTAIVKASNPNQAVDILKADGMYNSDRNNYLVTDIQQFNESPIEMLISEQNLTN